MKLQEVQIELTGICNATCIYCTWQKRTVGKQHMPTRMAMDTLDACKEMGVEVVRYHGVGESTLHPELAKIIAHGESIGLNHSISTNCFRLERTLAEDLARVKDLSVILAVPWVMNDRFVNQCIDNALSFLTISWNKRVHVQMVCHESARKHYRRFVDMFLPFVERIEYAFLHLKQPVTWPNDEPNHGFIEAELANHPKVIFGNHATPLSIGRTCNMPERLLSVLADGSIVPCCVGMDDWGLPKGLKQAWESPRMEEIRRLWRAKDDSIPCGHCLKRKDC